MRVTIKERQTMPHSFSTEPGKTPWDHRILAQIIQGSPIPTFVIDRQHTIIHCNRAYEALMGVSMDKILGISSSQFARRRQLADLMVDGAGESAIAEHYAGSYRESEVVEEAYDAAEFFPAMGEKGKWLYFTAAPLKDDEGKVVGAIETLQDVTERKVAEEDLRTSERRLRTLLDFIPYPIGVFTMEGRPTYLNPAFTQVFGWTLEELHGERVPFVPKEARAETMENLSRLYRDKILVRYQSKRLTKEGKVLDMSIRAAVYSESEGEPSGVIATFRDITGEKRIARQNEAMLRISTALPRYPDLEDLLDYINSAAKDLLGTEGSIVILLDEHKQDLFVLGAAYDDMDTKERIKEIRFGMDQLIAGRVIRSGEPLIVSDTSEDRALHEERDRRLGYRTRNLLLMPLKSSERVIGVICAINRKEGDFEERDVELLGTVAGTVALSIENARFSEELKKAYREVSSLNRAKDKAINHLSHELKTPVSILMSCIKILERSLMELPHRDWVAAQERAERNLGRVLEIQYEAADIMQKKPYRAHGMLTLLLEQCRDELESLAAEETGSPALAERIGRRIDELFLPKETVNREILLHEAVRARIEETRPLFSHRNVEIVTRLEPTPPILIPQDVLQKVFDGLLRNAIENTPDEAKVEVVVQRKGEGAELSVRDYGVGITEDAQRRIFEGFFTTRDTLAYSSKRPYDFMAGGKGADLLRMKIFSERYHFQIQVSSTRCRFMPREDSVCPGRITDCPYCSRNENCHQKPSTTFSVHFNKC